MIAIRRSVVFRVSPEPDRALDRAVVVGAARPAIRCREPAWRREQHWHRDLMPAHCVGEPFYDMVRREMPGKVFQSNVGTRYTFIA